jgi:enoyl-CoA hydratase
MEFKDYQHLEFERRDHGVLLMYLNRPEALNATNDRMHLELGQVWGTIGADPETRVVVVTGKGRAFSAGGDLAMAEAIANDRERIPRTVQEVADIVYNMMSLDKPIVSAINGAAVGAGLVVGVMADISIISETARITDGHTRLGVVAGDHAAIVWPLLCGMAKAKYYLLTSEFMTGAEAERIGLVSMCVPADKVLERSLEVASKLALGAQQAIRWTKRSLNNWMRVAAPIFDTSMALEILSFQGADVREGIAAIREKRAPLFPSAHQSGGAR